MKTTGSINVTSENIFPIIKQFLYSDHEIFLRELVSNAVDATQKMKTLKTWSKISKKGKFIKKRWMEFSKIYDLPLIITGLDALPKFEFKNKNNEILKNFILYEMLKKNILAKNVIYLSISHSDEQIKKYLNNLKKIFYKIKKNQLDHHNINNFYSKKLQITDIKLKRFN